jgi:protein-export membrane protein SecD
MVTLQIICKTALGFAAISLILSSAGCGSLKKLTRKGGTEFIVEIATDEVNKVDVVERAVRLLENKINATGIDADVAKIQDAPDRIKVTVYGNQPADAIKTTLFTFYRLELKKVIFQGGAPLPFTSENLARAELKDGQQVLPVTDFRETGEKKLLIVEREAVITGDDIRDASAFTRGGRDSNDYSIEFHLKPDAAAKFGDWTARNVGSYLAVVLNDEIQTYPIIKGQINDTGMIEGRFTKQSAEDIALSLRAGYLPATIKIINERPVGN